MVIQTLTLILCIILALIFPFMAWLEIRQFNIESKEWQEERSKLLDRIQSGGLSEFKAQERADTPIKRRDKNPALKKLDGEPWA